MDQINGQIIKILSDTEVIIDKGEVDGVKSGMEFEITSSPIEIEDLSGNNLGEFYYSKGKVYAKQVKEKFTLCTTGETTEYERVPSAFEMVGKLNPLSSKRKKVIKKEKLQVKDKDIDVSISTNVIIGDLVIENKVE